MDENRLGFWARLAMFFWLPWKVLFGGHAAWQVRRALSGEVEEKAPPPAEPQEPSPSLEALHLLAILQRDGRLVDFLQEDIAAATDDQVGAAARLVHEGCRKALAQYLTLVPLRSEGEGAAVVVSPGFDPKELRLTGNVVGTPPFRGTLAHPGWRVAEVRLPELSAEVDLTVIAPAEVEV